MSDVRPAHLSTPTSMRSWSRSAGGSIGFVPTMGALHDGHIALIGAARERADHVVVSIFVNPTQFDRADDFERYPRQIDDDLERCARLGVDAVYAPTAATMYPDGFQTTVSVGDLSSMMEGASRPGHFDGVTTVVNKLFGAVDPDVAVFGEKDFQQLVIVRRMVADLDLGIEIVGHPIVREPDGLAMSSRNARLGALERRAAGVVPRALDAAVAAASGHDVRAVVEAFEQTIETEPLATLDYVMIFDSVDLSPLERLDDDTFGRRRIACAVDVGGVRLIDNRDLAGI